MGPDVTEITITDEHGKVLKTGQYWCGIASENVAAVWPMVEDLAERLAQQGDGEWTADDLMKFCQRTDAEGGQLWLFGVPGRVDVMVITNFEETPQLKYMQLFGLVGEDLQRYYHYFHDVLVPFAKENGASYVQTFCRKGLEKTLKEWKKKYSVMRFYL